MPSLSAKVASMLATAVFLSATQAFVGPGRQSRVAAHHREVLKSAVAETNEVVTSEILTTGVNGDSQIVMSPAEDDDGKFQCDESVQFWRDFESAGNQGNFDRIRELLTRNMVSSSDDTSASVTAAYWSSQILRTSYFLATAALGTIGSDLHERFIAKRDAGESPSAGSSFLSLNGGSMTNNLLDSDVPSRLIFEALKAYEQDWKFVQTGLLNFPWDGIATANRDSNQVRLQLDHRQVNPLFALSETGRVIRESIGIFSRRNKFGGKPSGQVWMAPTAEDDVASKSLYPSYFLNDFHYQTDGWLSSESANTYEASTETLFLGRQDAMQRQTIIPLLKHFDSSQPKNILEVACGTGRFATFVRDNFPQAAMVLTDLSPFYLEKARENDKYWRGYRGGKAYQEKTDVVQGKRDAPTAATLVQANAEALPFEDESFDAVTCVYLFHELPMEAQENVAREMARVLRPGGMVVLSDSIQQGDRPALDKNMGSFARLNEPHYGDYMQTPLAPLFEKHGLVCFEKYVSSSTKTLSFTKPAL